MKYKIIFFDLHETLIKCRLSYEESYRNIALSCGIDLGRFDVKRKANEVWHGIGEDQIAQESVGLNNEEKICQWWSNYHLKVIKNVLPEIDEKKALEFGGVFNYQYCNNPLLFELHEGVFETLDILQKECKLILVSNSDKGVRGIIKYFKLDKYFSDIIISAEIGYSKPDTKILESSFKKYNTSPEKCLIVGDSYLYDIKMGIDSGIDTCLFTKQKKYTPQHPTIIVDKLIKLPNLLGIPKNPFLNARINNASVCKKSF